MTVNINVETICPNKLCSDNSYEIFIIKYLANSVYNDDIFLSVLEQTPAYSSFILGKTIFDLLNSLTESYRKYKNYEFLNSTDAQQYKNYKFYMNLYKVQFNSYLDRLQDLISYRVTYLNEISNSVSQISLVTDFDNSKLTYDIKNNTEAQRRVTYIKNIISDNINVFSNLVEAYKLSFPSTPILT